MDDFFLSTYHRQFTVAARSGRCPVWITEMGLKGIDPPEERERIMADLDARDTSEVLTGRWPGGCPCCNVCLDPFRNGFPGLLPRPAVGLEDAIWHAARVVDGEYLAEPPLVSAVRPADVPAILGWMGPWNSWQDTVGMSVVLRSWEERSSGGSVGTEARLNRRRDPPTPGRPERSRRDP